MNIAVIDVAAQDGGAATILEYFYSQHKSDMNNTYYYFLSTYELENTPNIKVLNFPNIKDGWHKRILFDIFGITAYLKKYDIQKVLSLQNIILPRFFGPQEVYIHNAIPFAEHRFSISESKYLWIYQNLIGALIKRSIHKADHVIVQTEWMKDAVCNTDKNAYSKVDVLFPELVLPTGYQYEKQRDAIFFYPASGALFKNHKVIIQACEILKKEGIRNYTVVFTLTGKENDEVKRLYNTALREQLNIQWIGKIERKECFDIYQKAVLLFPSYIETIGLPIYEAISVGSPLILSDCNYARSGASGYENVRYFKFDDPQALSEIIKLHIG